MQFTVLTIFPELINDFCNKSILGRVQKGIGAKGVGGKIKKSGEIKINAINIRAFASDKHKKVDDKPFGGGAGMVLKVEPIFNAIKKMGLLSANGKIKKSKTERVIVMTPKGAQFNQAMARRLAKYKKLVFICGRYEGIDERVSKFLAHEEISIGPYVLQGGEVAALTIIEAVSRNVRNVLGNAGSLKEETEGEEKEYPQFTRPDVFKPAKKGKGWEVPPVLLAGDHKKINAWRKEQTEL